MMILSPIYSVAHGNENFGPSVSEISANQTGVVCNETGNVRIT